MPFTNTLPIRRLGLVHGLLAGTDAGSPLAIAFYLATHTTSKGFSDSRFLPEMRREKSQATQPKEVKSSP